MTEPSRRSVVFDTRSRRNSATTQTGSSTIKSRYRTPTLIVCSKRLRRKRNPKYRGITPISPPQVKYVDLLRPVALGNRSAAAEVDIAPGADGAGLTLAAPRLSASVMPTLIHVEDKDRTTS